MADDVERMKGFSRERSPLASAAILLGLYVAMYLAVAAVVRWVEPSPAMAAAAEATHDTNHQAQPQEERHVREH